MDVATYQLKKEQEKEAQELSRLDLNADDIHLYNQNIKYEINQKKFARALKEKQERIKK